MKRSLSRVLGTLVFVLVASPLFAQATRTWVSGVGDDVNPCSRTAPCKTFAGAISKTATGGEINVLDPGGFGTVSITKAITIDGRNVEASILNSGGINGVIINAPATATVTLRNLQINGSGTTLGLNGVRILSAGSVRLENVTIFHQSGRGIDIQTPAAVNVSVDNCSIHNIGSIAIAAVQAGVKLDVFKSSILGSSSDGIFLGAGTIAAINDSTIAQNAAAGVVMTGAGTMATVSNSLISRNGKGIQAGTGVSTPTSIVGLSGNTITGNTTGVSVEGATVQSHGNNAIRRNTTDITGPMTSVGVQ